VDRAERNALSATDSVSNTGGIGSSIGRSASLRTDRLRKTEEEQIELRRDKDKEKETDKGIDTIGHV